MDFKYRVKQIPFFYYPLFYIKKGILKIWFQMCNRIYQFRRVNTNALKNFKDIYIGKRCFIICTGPSLTIDDLEKLSKEYTFSMNSIVNIYNKTSFRPKFYLIQDGKVEKKLRNKLINCHNSEYKTMFVGIGNVYGNGISISKRTATRYYPKAYYYNNDFAYHCYDMYYHDFARVEYSMDCSIEIKDGFTVTYAALELAIYMGFKKIYLLGCDSNRSGHIDSESNPSLKMQTLDRNIQAYTYIKDKIKGKNIKIYNATRGGMLEVFERVDLDDIV